MAKGYKLTSAAGDGPKTCAFYFSDKGCRNGASCKFSHEKVAANAAAAAPSPSHASPPSVSSSSVMSSESEASDGEIVESRAGAYASLARKGADAGRPNGVESSSSSNPFLSAVSAVVAPPPARAQVQAATERAVEKKASKEEEPPVKEPPTSEKKKRKRKKKQSELVPGESIFDLGTAEVENPAEDEPNGAAAAAPEPKAAAVVPPQKKKAKKAASVASPHNEQKQRPTSVQSELTPNFRYLQLPVASFSVGTAAAATAPKSPAKRSSSPQHDPAPPSPPLPLPTATPAHLVWKDAVVATRGHVSYANAFNYERVQKWEFANGTSSPKDWIAPRPYGKWCKSNPSAIAIDCEMCETKDPVSLMSDAKALCRVSVVNADNPDEVLLDTLVKPSWPVVDYRTWVNGISAKDLENVEFTLEHAQAFMKALCSEQTVVVGHAVHNDLLALRMIHHCNVDTAMLYTHKDENDGTPSLKNLALGVLKKEMPDIHDSVNDARVALACARHYVDNEGKVDPVDKVYSRSSSRVRTDAADTAMLLVHRLPNTTLPQHISEMFLAYTHIKPKKVPEIAFSGSHGKCHVEFSSKEHAELAYATLVGDEREDKTGKKQKRVGLKGGGYVCVRKMKKSK